VHFVGLFLYIIENARSKKQCSLLLVERSFCHGNPGTNFTFASNVICYQANQTVEIFHIRTAVYAKFCTLLEVPNYITGGKQCQTILSFLTFGLICRILVLCDANNKAAYYERTSIMVPNQWAASLQEPRGHGKGTSTPYKHRAQSRSGTKAKIETTTALARLSNSEIWKIAPAISLSGTVYTK
jgi:hypothetical protein